ncbi:uncharacterized protein [Triticum aestivum]|uniref:uncharacterized protein isoform X1 n=1 Tax=Triticum aestivum TaxID=4565 RepID=UPI001D032615|nr:uncharacterized protein LOC123136254 isoform X1 [Triticum aestivum]
MEVRSGPAAAMDGDAQNPSPPRTCAGCRPSPASSSTGLRLCCSDLEEGVELLLLQVALMRTSCFCRWTGPHGRHTLSSEVGRRSIGRRSRRAEPLVAASLTSFPSMLASVRCPLAVARYISVVSSIESVHARGEAYIASWCRIWLYGAGSWCRTQATQTQSILTTRPGDIVCTMFCSAICHFDMAKMLAFDMCQNYVAPPA